MHIFAWSLLILYLLATLAQISKPDTIIEGRKKNPERSLWAGVTENVILITFFCLFLFG